MLLAARLDPPATPGQVRAAAPGRAPGDPAGPCSAWAAFFAVSAVWAQLLDISESDDLPQELGVDSSTAALVAVAVLVCVLAPIAEELFFRGFCFTALRRTLGMLPGAVLTGIIFGAIHLGSSEIEFIVPLMVFGFLLCLLYVKTGSILPCIVLHALNNALALGVSEDWGAGIPLAMAAAAAASVAIVAAVHPQDAARAGLRAPAVVAGA